MKKQHVLFCLMLSFGGLIVPHCLQGQTITDANFANAIRGICPTCISPSNVLLAPATTLTTLDVSGEMIANLSGIGGFTNLQHLSCISNLLTNLPTLPNSLVSLDCTNNQLSSLPTLPPTLTTLNCSANQLNNLPTLPAALTTLNCSSNGFSVFPTLPSTLLNLQCYGGQFTSLPSLPTGLRTLNCGDGKLTTLPNLPTTLTTLFCYNNRLTTLPTLPTSLTWLSCGNNLLTSLPTLPTGLTRLFCAINPLGSLPTLPTGLTHLHCYGNQLTQLPSLPTTLKILHCYDNQLTLLPTLPNSLVELIIDVSITCIPNQVVGLIIYDKDYRILTRPTCPIIPVELLYFKGQSKDKTTVLTWVTASETNNKGFEVERRNAASGDWETLGFVAAKGKAATYDFVDNTPLAVAYYRLRQIDNDGKETLSKVIAIQANGKTTLKAYPSVTTGILTIETTDNANIQVFNLFGQQVLTGRTSPSGAGSLDVSALPQGAYLLKVGTEQVKFLKQ